MAQADRGHMLSMSNTRLAMAADMPRPWQPISNGIAWLTVYARQASAAEQGLQPYSIDTSSLPAIGMLLDKESLFIVSAGGRPSVLM